MSFQFILSPHLCSGLVVGVSHLVSVTQMVWKKYFLPQESGSLEKADCQSPAKAPTVSPHSSTRQVRILCHLRVREDADPLQLLFGLTVSREN